MDIERLAKEIALAMAGTVDFEDFESCKIYWDWYSITKTTLMKEENQERLRIAMKLKADGLDLDYISELTLLPISVIEKL